jgi:hypothetical protein
LLIAPRTDPYERSLAHTAPISDDWKQAIKNSLSAHSPAFSKAFKRVVGANTGEYIKRGFEGHGDAGMAEDY